MGKRKTPEQRIVVTIDTAARAEPAIAVATALAKAYRCALHGLFIENTELLAVAGLPFTREFPRAGGPPRELSNTALERQMARLAEQYRSDLERQARAAAVPWSYTRVRTSKRLAMGEAGDDLLVIGQPATIAPARAKRILLLGGKDPAVLRALDTVLQSPGYEAADLMVHGEFDAQALNEILAQHPQVKRLLMGGPTLRKLLTASAYRPGLVLLARSADQLDACLKLAECPVIAVAEG